MTDPMTPDRCDRCGGDPTTRNDGGVPVVECADCGNVLGLGDPPDPGGGGSWTDTVRAADGDLGELVALLRAEADAPDGTVTADRLLLEAAASTLEVTATDGRIEIRELDADGTDTGG